MLHKLIFLKFAAVFSFPPAKTIRYSDRKDEELYMGQVANGEPHGRGILEYKNGNTYYGHFDKGIKQGLGFWEYSTNDDSSALYFAGNFEEDQINGNGTFVWSDAVYFGEFFDGSISGKGLYLWDSGIISKGIFKVGEQTGYGTDYYADGEKYEGNFENGKRQGFGIYTYGLNDATNALSYVGYFEDNLKSGSGTFKWTTGSKYVGEFKYDLRNGYGTQFFSDGSRYQGNWEDGSENGYGKLFLANGTLDYEGDWVNGDKQQD